MAAARSTRGRKGFVTMSIPSAQAMLDLPYPNVKDITSVNRTIASSVHINTKRDQAIPRPEVEKTGGLVLSQYAKILGAERLVLRTYDVDLALWFAAGTPSPIELQIDQNVEES